MILAPLHGRPPQLEGRRGLQGGLARPAGPDASPSATHGGVDVVVSLVTERDARPTPSPRRGPRHAHRHRLAHTPAVFVVVLDRPTSASSGHASMSATLTCHAGHLTATPQRFAVPHSSAF